MKRIIDSKQLEMTNDEFELYQTLCKSYDRPNFQGKELFKDHFDTNDAGIIVFVRPPSGKYSSLEVYCFLISLMVNQHLRISREQSLAFVREASEEILELINENKEMKDEIKSLIEKSKAVE